MSDIVVFTSINDEDVAEEIISDLLEAGLVRSGTILPGKTLYKWDGQMTIDEEFKIMLKSGDEQYPEIEKYILSKHPYLVPEVIKFSVSFGSEFFWQQVDEKKRRANA